MAFIKVMRRKDAPHVYFPANAAMRARTDVLEEAWLDTQTHETSLEKPKAPAKQRRKKAAPEQISLPDLDDLE